MEPDRLREQQIIYRAATATFDYNNISRAFSGLLALTTDLLNCEQAALFEFDEAQMSYLPRYGHGLNIGDLGRLTSSTEHSFLRSVLATQKVGWMNSEEDPMGLPIGPGPIACAPCVAADQTIGILFVGRGAGAFNDDELIALQILAARGSEILGFARQNQTQSYLFHRLSLLYQASHAIATTHDRHETIKQTASHLLKATSADLCDTYLFINGSTQITRFQHQPGPSMPHVALANLRDHPPAYRAHEEVLTTLRPVRLSVTPPLGVPEDIAALQIEGHAAAAIFPLATGNQTLGLVRLLFEKSGRQISEQEMELAGAVINIGAVGLQDAIHLEAAQTRASQLQVLSEIGREVTSSLDLEAALRKAMRHAQGLLGVEACVLFLLDEERDRLVLKASGGSELRMRSVEVDLNEGIAGWVASNCQPLIVNDVRNNPHFQSNVDSQTGMLTTSILCVPLETRGKVLGVVEAINHPGNLFDEVDQQMLLSVASWAAIGVDNANLFRQVAEERSRLETTLVETADAVILTDPAGTIILANRAALKAFGLNPRRTIGHRAADVFLHQPLGALLVDEGIELPTNLEIVTPTDRVLHASISEVTDIGRVAVMQDITALKQIDRMRSQLLGTAAHDLKNPLNAIRLGADLLHEAPLSDQQRKALQMMQRATESMTNLITGLLETIRVESSANFNFESCSMHELIMRAIDDLTPLAEDRQQQIRYERPADYLAATGDPTRLKSVITNLLSNAIKFSDPGSLIEVEVNGDDLQITLCVRDQGPGIHEEEIPRVFEHLFRGRAVVRDPNNPVEGTGLGLALSKTIVEQHGGRIWVTSQFGHGSSFFVSLPRDLSLNAGSS